MTVPVVVADATDFDFSTRGTPVVSSATLLTAGAVVAADPVAADPASDNRQHQSLLVREPFYISPWAPHQHPDDHDDDDVDDHQLALLPEGDVWPAALKQEHKALLFVPPVPRRGHQPGVSAAKAQQPDFVVWMRQVRSVVGSYLRTVGLRHLNYLAEHQRRTGFDRDDLPMLEYALEYAALHANRNESLWFEDEGRLIPGLGSRVEMRNHFALRGRMPLSVLREMVHEVAEMLILPGTVPFRVQTYEVRRTRLEWLQAPRDGAERPDLGVIPKRDQDYFKKHGLYPPHWRPLEQRASDWGTVAAHMSWENRKFDPIVLLGLTPGSTTREQVQELQAKGIDVKSATVTRWRKQLIDNGIVARGKEPWATGTTTAANRKKI